MRRYLVLTSLLLLPLWSGWSETQEKDTPREPRLVPYKQLADDEALKLHVFTPDGPAPEGGRTAIVFFFGGGWITGKPEQFYPQARHLVERGLLAISAEYRVSSRHHSTVRDSVADAKSAMRYVRSHADVFGINPDKIIAAGGSAGGHLAACTGILTEYDDEKDDATVSPQPNAMILLNPVVDTTPLGYLGRLLPPKGDKTLSPVHHVRPGLPPTLVCHGTADIVVGHENVERFQKAMEDAGNRCELKSFKGAGHGFFNPGLLSDKDYHAVVAEMDAFIDSLNW